MPVWRPWIFLFVILSIFILAGNILALVVFLVAKPLSFNVRCLLINLAIADSLVGSLALPMYSALLAKHFTGSFSPSDSLLSLVYTVIDIFAAYASILSLAAIAIDRARAVVWSVSHQSTRGHTYLVAVVLIWLGAAVIALLFILQSKKVIDTGGFFYPMILTFFVTVLVIIIVYLYLWFVVTRITIDQASGARTLEKSLGITFLLITVLFIVMWVPFQILNILVYQEGGKCHLFDCKFEMIAFSKLFHYGNSLVNPLIYSFRLPAFRKAAVRLLCFRNVRPPPITNVTMNSNEQQGTKDQTFNAYNNAGYDANYEQKATFDNPGFTSEPPGESQHEVPPSHYRTNNSKLPPAISPGDPDSSKPSIFI